MQEQNLDRLSSDVSKERQINVREFLSSYVTLGISFHYRKRENSNYCEGCCEHKQKRNEEHLVHGKYPIRVSAVIIICNNNVKGAHSKTTFEMSLGKIHLYFIVKSLSINIFHVLI